MKQKRGFNFDQCWILFQTRTQKINLFFAAEATIKIKGKEGWPITSTQNIYPTFLAEVRKYVFLEFEITEFTIPDLQRDQTRKNNYFDLFMQNFVKPSSCVIFGGVIKYFNSFILNNQLWKWVRVTNFSQ